MVWHELDSDLEVKFVKLREQEEIFEKQLRKIRSYQTRINNLKMVQIKQTNKDDVVEIVYTQPLNNAGNEMNEDYKNEQKAALIVNIDEFLGVE